MVVVAAIRVEVLVDDFAFVVPTAWALAWAFAVLVVVW